MVASVGTVSVLTQHNDNSRTGANLQEGVLNTTNVNQQQFGRLFTCPVQGQIYAQPLYVSNMNIPNKGSHNVVYVATMHNMVYAFDADDPKQATTPLWQRALEPSVPLPDIMIGPTNNGQSAYHDIANEIGIVSTPVISLAHHALYVVTFTKTGNTYAHKLHALDLSTGADLFGGPTTISANVRGTGAGSVNGTITFTSNRQIQRSDLLLANETIYIAFASYGDTNPYHGWVLAYGASTLQRGAIFNTTPNGQEGRGGIWQAGQGPSADSNNSIYFLTGNGSFTNGSDFSDCFVKLRPNLTVLDWFSSFNNDALNKIDADVGSSGALLLPGTNLLVGGGKEGKFYLMDRNHMGHFNANNNNQIVQSFLVSMPDDPNDPIPGDYHHTHHIHGGPVYWNGPNGPWVYVWPENDFMKAFKFVGGQFQTTPVSQSTTMDPDNVRGGTAGMPGGILSISANGSTNGIVWSSHSYRGNANQAVVPGIVRVYDATDLTKELWNSKMNAQRDDIGNLAKFCPPTVANGKVYMASFSGSLAVYGLLKTS